MNIFTVLLSPRIFMVMAILGVSYATWSGELTVTNALNYLSTLTTETVAFIHSINWSQVITTLKSIAGQLH